VRDYFLRRLLLIVPTLLGVTLLVFAITRVVPGPVVRAIMAAVGRSQASAWCI
jgi:microcin C transport system permease protein